MPVRNDHHVDQHVDQHTDADTETIAALRRLGPTLRHPVAMAVIAVISAVALFMLGRSIGSTIYRAFDGDDAAAVRFGAAFIGLLALIATTVAIAEVRSRRRSSNNDHPPRSEGRARPTRATDSRRPGSESSESSESSDPTRRRPEHLDDRA